VVFAAIHSRALAQLQAASVTAELAERQAFVAGVRAMFLLSAAICSVAVVMSFIRGEEKVSRETEGLAAARP
ncbi:MAG TPA: hypothetical protein VNO70_21420, partial [Blastocatellia bacterium]|nr:hypothetical protein [Blastocatellia bacterium]